MPKGARRCTFRLSTITVPAEGHLVEESALLGLFTCPGCRRFVTREPIICCSKGHVVCPVCAVDYRGSCPNCRQRIVLERNHQLEKVAQCINFPTEGGSNNCLSL
ncbi:E3 ubiquitin-protein ligase sina-like isoform X2 [Artemia franciscana]|uniref:E3 ubiquitin-protein ligase sina-like isoform X2 n=1 Tax=Artemia franciscana TaxID=6661 RepID=UPI0032D9B031